MSLAPLPYRSIQIGLSEEAMRRYVKEWIRGIADVTSLAKRIHELTIEGQLCQATALLPEERPYPVPEQMKWKTGCS